MKLDRLLAITMLLLNRKRVGAKELADRFEVSLRTIYRDLETIDQAGIPIVSYSGAAGGYEIMDSYRIERQYLSVEELQAIVIALKGIRSSFDEQDIGSLLDKVGALAAKSEQGASADLSQQIIFDLHPWHSSEQEKIKLSILRTAIRNTQLVRFSYTSSQGNSSERGCEPMGVVLKGYAWYLYGYCRLRGDYRIFRLSRIEHLTALPEMFKRRPETLDKLDYRWMQRDNEPNRIRLVLQFHPRMKAKVQDYFVHGTIAAQPDGTLLVTAEQPDEPWLYGMLLSYGADVRIIEPQTVAQAVRMKAQQIVELYQTALT